MSDNKDINHADENSPGLVNAIKTLENLLEQNKEMLDKMDTDDDQRPAEGPVADLPTLIDVVEPADLEKSRDEVVKALEPGTMDAPRNIPDTETLLSHAQLGEHPASQAINDILASDIEALIHQEIRKATNNVQNAILREMNAQLEQTLKVLNDITGEASETRGENVNTHSLAMTHVDVSDEASQAARDRADARFALQQQQGFFPAVFHPEERQLDAQAEKVNAHSQTSPSSPNECKSDDVTPTTSEHDINENNAHTERETDVITHDAAPATELPLTPAPSLSTERERFIPEHMEKTYNPHAIEERWYHQWEEKELFKPNGDTDAVPYCVMLPPPNVTGSLHMGHAFQDTLMDILIRYHRMKGHNTLWQCGTDHAGIATQMVVERQLAAKDQSRHDLGRDQFVDEVWKWKAESGGNITRQLRRMGTSMDWTRERFTLDEGLSDAVQEVFIQLYEEELIYRGKRLVNWDPVLHTAISDLEVISQEENGHLWHIRYPIAGQDGHVVVATTRPETMLGDAAVAVHPDDERYQDLIGKRLKLPLTSRTIPVIADDYVDPEFGSGCVKITPAHDFNDYQVGQRHDLPLLNIFTDDAAMNDECPRAYRGLDRYAARKQILADLEAEDLIEKIDDHKLMVPRGDRSNAVIEPYLTDQWYVKIDPLAKPAIEAVENGDISFVPETWSKTYFEWMRNIEDWCISRQLWWGHRIPAWYDQHGGVYVGRSEEEIREKHKLGIDYILTQDEDVLDTWFSSALWPFSTLGWPEKTPELETFYPTSVLVTGFDIIFFWVARMIMMGLKFTGEVPFKEVYIHGLVRDAEGQKMSKSKGNIIDPIDLIDGIDLETLVQKRTSGLMKPKDAAKIEKATRKQFADGMPSYGTDALRFTFAAQATLGRDIRFDMGRIEGYRNFCNKLWNATRYVMMTTEDHVITEPETKHLGVADRWIVSRFEQVTKQVSDYIENYRFDLAAQAVYEFTWDEYCDWYVELSKATLNSPRASEDGKNAARYTLVSTLESLLRLIHPFMPFITEELWQRVTLKLAASSEGSDETSYLMTQTYPGYAEERVDEAVIEEVNWLKQFVLGVRRVRAEMDISPGKKLRVVVEGGDDKEKEWLKNNVRYLVAMAKLESVGVLRSGTPPESATALAGNMTLLIPLEDLIDPTAEKERLSKELEKLHKEKEIADKKLANPDFVERAPAPVVQKAQDRLDEVQASITRLEEQLTRINGMLKS